MNFRLLQTGFRSAFFNMALDEVLVAEISAGKSDPCLRFYGWEPQAISIGYFQSLLSEVDEEKCKNLGIDIVRRQTGGGAVFHADEITYSIHIPMNLNIVPLRILDSYQKICDGIINGLKELNIEANFAPLNDIITGGQKISGNAQTRKQGIILQHGTIIKSVDVDKMFELLKVPDEKMKGKLISDIKQRVTSVDKHTNQKFSFQDVIKALIKGFAKTFPEINFINSELTEEEIAQTQKLAKEKYEKKSWNFLR
ncbi:lipoate--protein ligase [Candidatus Peregrinibacteria bacterium RIFOXYB2_FULL_32_7]|nr:MAG: lipoate--protein ligase [Candidatus Peregrinibacteria bacterium RIFOXYB2_FULL_32_7]